MEKLKSKCQYHNNTTNFIKEIIKVILIYDEQFNVKNLVNTTFNKFLEKNEMEIVKNTMEDMKMVYFCVGPDFLLHQIQPLT